ncbi:MAG TPA: CHAT domain-containing tetratricopeptide repeat protein [Myxococcaceae bacterium]|nr:CHAT domain-containing tetratricopeptide repeat protein [Myxococcaceae bacterium]
MNAFTLGAFTWMVVLALGGAGCATVDKPPVSQAPVAEVPAAADTRLEEAQRAFEASQKLRAERKWAEARAEAERSLKLREEVLGPTHPRVADSLRQLGETVWPTDAAAAEPLYLRALAIQEAAYGPQAPELVPQLKSLHSVYVNLGLYSRAEHVIQRALTLQEATLGKEHPEVASSLRFLGQVYFSQGLYSQAEPLYQRAYDIWEASLGKEHPELASALNDLGIVYLNQGAYARAEAAFERARALAEAGLGPQHHMVAHSLQNLARAYLKQRQYARAEPLQERALAIQEANFGKRHPLVAQALDQLATLHARQGRYAQAEALYQRALTMVEELAGKNHLVVSHVLVNLARLHRNQGHYAQAEPALERALAIREAVSPGLGFTMDSLRELGLLRVAQGRRDEARELFEQAFARAEARLRQEALTFSEERMASFLELVRGDEERLYAFARASPGDARVHRLALAAALLLKGRSAEELAHTSRAIYRDLGPGDRDTFMRLRELRTRYAELALAGAGKQEPARHQRQLQELADQAEALQTELIEHSAPLRALSALPSPAQIVDRVAQALPSDSALVEFVAYEDRPLVPRPGTLEEQLPSELRFLALVLLADGRVSVIDLGPAAPIHQAVERLRKALVRRTATWQSASRELYRLAFKPLLPVLGKARRLSLSTDGQLSLVPFAALHDGQRFLAEAFHLGYHTSGKELLPRPERSKSASTVIVVADPDFDSAPAALASAERSAALETFFSTRSPELISRPWAPLPGTRQEALAIQHLLPQARLLLGAEASKQALLRLPTPGILHVATHGFFLDDTTAAPGTRAVGQFGAVADPGPRNLPPNPLLRSGLVLAGAREASSEAAHVKDSLATALELSSMNLWGTQLVVLSACDTGQGEVKLGQGVYGLRRALRVAGAQTVVMSLWKVNDETTRELMVDYYRRLLAGEGRAAALAEAMRSLRARHAHPYYWAPFVAIGVDSPLEGLAP